MRATTIIRMPSIKISMLLLSLIHIKKPDGPHAHTSIYTLRPPIPSPQPTDYILTLTPNAYARDHNIQEFSEKKCLFYERR